MPFPSSSFDYLQYAKKILHWSDQKLEVENEANPSVLTYNELPSHREEWTSNFVRGSYSALPDSPVHSLRNCWAVRFGVRQRYMMTTLGGEWNFYSWGRCTVPLTYTQDIYCFIWSRILRITLSDQHLTTAFGPFKLQTRGLLQKEQDHSLPKASFNESSSWFICLRMLRLYLIA